MLGLLATGAALGEPDTFGLGVTGLAHRMLKMTRGTRWDETGAP